MAGRTVPAILVGMDAYSGAAIRVEELQKRFGSKIALDGIDLVVPTGAVFELLGANGAGKATTTRILATILRPDAGLDAPQPGELVPHPVELERGGGQEGNLLPLGERHAALLTEAEAGDDEPRDSLGDEDLDRLGVREGRVFAARPSA